MTDTPESMAVSQEVERVLDRAWRYHQNADTMQHQRHIVFMLLQTLLFAGVGKIETRTLAVIGIVSAGLWCAVANSLEKRLDAMRKILNSDPVWRKYAEPVPLGHLLGGRMVFNNYLPALAAVGWGFVWVTKLGSTAKGIAGESLVSLALGISSFAEGVLASFLAATLFALVLYRIYVRSAFQLKRSPFARDLWWLPGWHCWRFVLRNIGGDANIWEIEYRCWLREIAPTKSGSSVKSFRDTELEVGKRIILPAGQDLPILCFRFEEQDGDLVLMQTDKFGNVVREFRLVGPNNWEIKAEYSFHTTSRVGLPHRVQRLLTIPEKAKSKRGDADVFKQLLSHQGQPEHTVPLVITGAEQISVKHD